MAHFLITGSRSPAALELTRNLTHHGHQVSTVDCLHLPLSRYSRLIKNHYLITAPRKNVKQFKKDLLKIIEKENIDYLLPTCEEIFYIAYLKKTLGRYCDIISSDIDFLTKAHSKYQIFHLAQNCGIEFPDTELIDDKKLIDRLHENWENKIIKREYSRFGTGVLLNPKAKNIIKLIQNGGKNSHYLIQDKIHGNEICTYSIAHKGNLYAHSSYRPKYRIKNSASIYFSKETNSTLEKFVRNFVKKHEFSGQISFDFMKNDNGISLIECNPRATSGIHLFNKQNIGDAILGLKTITTDTESKAAMSAAAMILNALPQAIIKRQTLEWLRDYRHARDIIFDKKDPFLFFSQYLSIAEILLLAIRNQSSIRDATTYGINWDGEILSSYP